MGKCFDLLLNSLNELFKELYGGQLGEFVYGLLFTLTGL